MNDAAPSASTADRETSTSRVLHAPRAAVFAAFRDPAILARWWGPAGFTNTFETFEFEPGGTWRFVMHGPDGRDYPNESRFLEVVADERIVFRHVVNPVFDMHLTFEDHADGTRLGWRMVFEKASDLEALKKYAPEGNEQNLDRLQAVLAANA